MNIIKHHIVKERKSQKNKKRKKNYILCFYWPLFMLKVEIEV